MLLAQLGETWELRRVISDCFLLFQLGGLSVLLTFEMTLSRKDWLGASVSLSFDLGGMGDSRL